MLFKRGVGTEGKNYSKNSKDLFGPLVTSKEKNRPYVFAFLMLFSDLILSLSNHSLCYTVTLLLTFLFCV